MTHVLARIVIVAACMTALTIIGCGKDDDGRQPTQSTEQPGAQSADQGVGQTPSPSDMARLAEQNRQALAQANQGKQIQAMGPDALKALLPADLPGMKRTDASAERTQTMGFDIANATGEYQSEDGNASVRVTVTDLGNMSGQMRMGMAAWAMAQYSRETDTGYEKTTTYGGYKAMEEYNKADRTGAIRVFVADRFVVAAEGNGVTMETLKQALDKIDLKKLATAGS